MISFSSPVVAVGDVLLQDSVYLWVVADLRPSELLREASVAHLLSDTRVLHRFYRVALLQLLEEVAVGQFVSFVEEEAKGLCLHYIEAYVFDRRLRLVGLPCVELVGHRDTTSQR